MELNQVTATASHFPNLAVCAVGRQVTQLEEQNSRQAEIDRSIQKLTKCGRDLMSPCSKAAYQVFVLYKKLLELEGITHLNPERTPLATLRLFARLLILKSIIEVPVGERSATYTTKGYLVAIKAFFCYKSVGQDFFALVKDLLPPPNNEKHKLIRNLSFFLSREKDLSEEFDFMVPVQLNEIIERTAGKDFSSVLREFANFHEEAEEVHRSESVQDHDKQISFAHECHMAIMSRLEPEVGKQQGTIDRTIAAIIRETTPYTKPSQKKGKARLVPCADGSKKHSHQFLQHLKIVVPACMGKKLSEMNAIYKRICMLAQIAGELNCAKAGPIAQKIAKLQTKQQKMSESLEDTLIGLKFLIHLQHRTLTDETLEAKCEEVVNKLCEQYTIQFHGLIIDLAMKIIEEEAEEAPLTPKHLEDIYKAAVGHVIVSMKTPGTRQPFNHAAHKIKLSGPLRKYMMEKLKEAEKSCLDAFAEPIANDNPSIKAIVLGIMPNGISILLSSILALEIEKKMHLVDIANIVKALEESKQGFARENVVWCLIETKEMKTALAKTLYRTKDKFRDLVADHIYTLFQLSDELPPSVKIPTELFLRELFGYLNELMDASGMMMHQTIYTTSVFTSLVNIVFDLSIKEGVDLCEFLKDTDTLTQVEQEKDKAEEKFARLALEELLLEEEQQKSAAIVELPAVAAQAQTTNPDLEPSPPITTESPEKETNVLTEPAAEAAPLYVPSCFRINRSLVTLGETKTTAYQAALAQSQIYMHHAFAIATQLQKRPRLCKALTPSLLESMHLCVEQRLTAEGIEKHGIAPSQFQGHNLTQRTAACGFVKLMPLIGSLTKYGTYLARYPCTINWVEQHQSLDAVMLDELRLTNTISSRLLEQTMQTLLQINVALDQVQPALLPDIREFQPSCRPEEMIPFRSPELRRLKELFSFCGTLPESAEKNDLIQLLIELEEILQMIESDKGIQKELLGTIVHAVFRIRQYAIKNALVCKLMERQGEAYDPEITPATPIKIAELLNLQRDLVRDIGQAHLAKGLDYPLAKRTERSLNEGEKALVAAYKVSLESEGFRLAGKSISVEWTLSKLDEVTKGTFNILEAILAADSAAGAAV